ncbi:molybdate ABC transporter substrate-binding protein [Shewanella sp. Choline-02u-19]|uniref:molybdate ABC transporter substrate-binding protein n=1 Tax=unclassified Shewanella TaxID=196818 RepID=UPI000C348047|nr:molybdate ABC transporter substrate-binding protein [Shewanella sp. GutCb]PKH58210.1 molybdate ABC transporter substrate-binding protein [Shewanella sp. Bg11-22]PKI29527.1 molybdate ABC transporter substrate-binding protein [Shewanella sp. Choline-02u-19]
MKLSVVLLSVLMPLLLLSKAAVATEDVPAIAAASSIKFALDDVAKQFNQDTGGKVRITYGSSGNFVAQIKHGAPFEIFLSADERYTNQLASAGQTQGKGIVYAVGKLALAAPKTSPLVLDENLDGLKQLMDTQALKRFAIANPDHAPYGERAKEALQNLGLWQKIQPQLIFGENVSQAAQFALSGSTQGGLIALSLASAERFKSRANYVVIPQSLYSPLKQRMVLTLKAGQTANEFYHYIQTDKAQHIFAEYGFGKAVN